jgi:hypothetical protein
MIYAIETDNRAVALTRDVDYVARLNANRGNDPHGVSPFAARAATESESKDFQDWQAATGLSCMTLPALFEHRG